MRRENQETALNGFLDVTGFRGVPRSGISHLKATDETVKTVSFLICGLTTGLKLRCE
jgi:hypothetical protein